MIKKKIKTKTKVIKRMKRKDNKTIPTLEERKKSKNKNMKMKTKERKKTEEK